MTLHQYDNILSSCSSSKYISGIFIHSVEVSHSFLSSSPIPFQFQLSYEFLCALKCNCIFHRFEASNCQIDVSFLNFATSIRTCRLNTSTPFSPLLMISSPDDSWEDFFCFNSSDYRALIKQVDYLSNFCNYPIRSNYILVIIIYFARPRRSSTSVITREASNLSISFGLPSWSRHAYNLWHYSM